MDTAVELANEIFSEGGIIALVLIVVLLILGGLVYTMFTLVRQNKDDGQTVLAQATTIADLVKSMKEIADANADVSANLVKVAELMSAHDRRVSDKLDEAVGAMRESVDQRKVQLGEIPQRVKDQMKEELDGLPQAVENALAPLLKKLFDDLMARIEQVPGSTSQLVCAELAAMKDMINQSIRDMIAETLARSEYKQQTEDKEGNNVAPSETTTETTQEA